MIDFSQVQDVLKNVDDLPTLPSTVTTLMDLLNNDKSTPGQVAMVLMSDQSLATKVLRIVNSPFYGLKNKLSSVEQAVVVLGFSNIRSIVLGASVIDAFANTAGEYFKPKAFWRHSIASAAATSTLARELELEKPEDGFTAGLLSLIGLLVMDQFMPAMLLRIRERVEEDDMMLVDAEEAEMGFDHAKIGAFLLREWHLPDRIVDAVAYHLFPETCPGDKRLASCIQVGDTISRALGFGYAGDAYVAKISSAALEALYLTPDAFEALVGPVDAAVEKSQVFMNFVK